MNNCSICAIADLWPKIVAVKDDSNNSPPKDNPNTEITKIKIPMIDLPLGGTEGLVWCTIDIEKALTDGVKAFEPGLLAKAHCGII